MKNSRLNTDLRNPPPCTCILLIHSWWNWKGTIVFSLWLCSVVCLSWSICLSSNSFPGFFSLFVEMLNQYLSLHLNVPLYNWPESQVWLRLNFNWFWQSYGPLKSSLLKQFSRSVHGSGLAGFLVRLRF